MWRPALILVSLVLGVSCAAVRAAAQQQQDQQIHDQQIGETSEIVGPPLSLVPSSPPGRAVLPAPSDARTQLLVPADRDADIATAPTDTTTSSPPLAPIRAASVAPD